MKLRKYSLSAGYRLVLILLTLFFSGSLFSQVRIKESVIIKPTITDSVNRFDGLNTNQSATVNAQYESLFLECGGSVTLRVIVNVGTIILIPSMQVIVENPIQGHTYPVGTFAAGAYLKIGKPVENEPPIAFTNHYGAMGVDNYYEIGLLLYGHQIANLNFNVGDSCTCLDLRPPNGPPREPQPIVAPADTHLVVDFWRMKGRDSLYFYTQNELLRDTLFLDSALLRRAPVIDLGSVQMGDIINFFLKSMVKFTQGEIMYPKSVFYGDSWNVAFENWIDSHFRDYTASLYMVPSRYKIQFDKEKVLPGDTVRFQIEVIGTPNQYIESELDVNILKGRQYAVIVDTNGILYGTDLSGSNRNYQPFAQIKNKLALVISDTTPIGEKIILQVASNWSGSYSGRTEIEVQNQPTILLGESKYYQAEEINNQLKVFEYSAPQNGSLSNVTFKVDTVNCTGAGKRLGVYYEYKKPDGESLPTDQIRLIGRYWHQDSTYKVRLVASKDGKTDTLIIDVIKPNRLGNTHANKIDVFNNQFNLDSLIIYYAGLNGIPPQMIKGQIEEESSFKPSYLYEPFEDLKLQTTKSDSIKLYSNRYRIISSTDMGDPVIPTNHTNVWNVLGKTNYPGYVGSIWEYYNQYKNSLYARVNSKGEVVYKSLNDIWKDSLFNPIKDSLIYWIKYSNVIAEKEAEKIANDSLPKYLRYIYKNGYMDKRAAQTRIFASYGLLQMIYYYATKDVGYPVDGVHLPETININDTCFIYSLNYLKSRFKQNYIQQNFNASTGWSYGFEETFRRTLNRYRGEQAIRGSYGNEVFRRAKNYLPIITK